MSQKVSLISTLTKNATCYIFDEPTSGLDKESIELFVKEIDKLLKLDKKVIVITHNTNFYNNLKYHLYEISEISEKIN
jgi:ABC-type multidrug transport system ATPase subunit